MRADDERIQPVCASGHGTGPTCAREVAHVGRPGSC
jgi:hypothetical protein